ncbi:MAG: SGNH/GDSL hydrolase family protein, partial [Actinomycetota bacterium]
DGGDALEVWFFGGSTMFGEGQRDEHTIPSEIARIAADEGLTVRPVNFGHQGWVLWQEMLKFEQEVAREGPPDLAIFYDGVNDYNLQVVYGGGQPLHDELARCEASGQDGAVPLPAGSVGESPSVWRTYRSTSLFDKLLDRAGSLALGRPAGATPSDPEDERLGERFVEIVADVSEAYGRSVERTQAVAAAAETPVRLFWQPVRGQGPDYGALARQVPDGVTDISDTFDDVTEPIFIDGGHTNEAGARIVAERLFAEVATDLAAIAERRAP